MGFDLSTLTTYVDEQKMPLIKKMILGSRALEYMTVQPDIKTTATINILTSDLIAQPGGCGFSSSGTTTISQNDLTVCPLSVKESFCLDDLEKYFTQKSMNPGSYNEEIPFEGLFAEDKVTRIAALVEDLAFKGDTVNGTGNLSLCDGILKKAETTYSGQTVNGNPGGVTAITASNIISIVDAAVAAIPTDIIDQEDLILYCGYDFYRMYATALRNANLFHYTGAENQGEQFSQVIPGTNVRIVAFRGLNNTNKFFITPKSNLYFGTDLLNDYEDFDLFYSKDNQEMRMVSKWRQGINAAFYDFFVYFQLA